MTEAQCPKCTRRFKSGIAALKMHVISKFDCLRHPRVLAMPWSVADKKELQYQKLKLMRAEAEKRTQADLLDKEELEQIKASAERQQTESRQAAAVLEAREEGYHRGFKEGHELGSAAGAWRQQDLGAC